MRQAWPGILLPISTKVRPSRPDRPSCQSSSIFLCVGMEKKKVEIAQLPHPSPSFIDRLARTNIMSLAGLARASTSGVRQSPAPCRWRCLGQRSRKKALVTAKNLLFPAPMVAFHSAPVDIFVTKAMGRVGGSLCEGGEGVSAGDPGDMVAKRLGCAWFAPARPLPLR